MGNTDSTPGLSQVKSLIQATVGDVAGAYQTQQNFVYKNTFPVLSQIASARHAIAGDFKSAEDLQKRFADDLESVVDSTPVIGHVKGGVHFAMGENEKGEGSMKASSRASGIIAGGTAGFLVAGPVGGALGALNGETAMDALKTGGEILANGEDAEPYGYGAIVHNLKHSGEEISSSDGVEMVAFTASDLISGALMKKQK